MVLSTRGSLFSIPSGLQWRRNWHCDEEVARQNVGQQVTERRRQAELVCGYPSIRFGPLPTRGRKAFNRFLQILRSHGLDVDTDIFRQEPGKSLKKSARQSLEAVFPRTDKEREAYDEADRLLCIAVYKGRLRVKFLLPEHQDISPTGAKRVHPG